MSAIVPVTLLVLGVGGAAAFAILSSSKSPPSATGAANDPNDQRTFRPTGNESVSLLPGGFVPGKSTLTGPPDFVLMNNKLAWDKYVAGSKINPAITLPDAGADPGIGTQTYGPPDYVPPGMPDPAADPRTHVETRAEAAERKRREYRESQKGAVAVPLPVAILKTAGSVVGTTAKGVGNIALEPVRLVSGIFGNRWPPWL